MTRPWLAALAIIALSLVAAQFLSAAPSSWVSLLCLAAMAMALVLLVTYEDMSLFFVTVFFINHVAFVGGGLYANALLLGAVLLFSPVFLYLKRPKRMFPLLLMFALALFYYLLVAVLRPYNVNMYWVVLHVGAIIAFALTQFFSWDIDKIASVAKLHMLLLSVFGVVEIAVSGMGDRIGGPLMSATAYGMQLVTVWSFWFSAELLKPNPRYGQVAVYSALAFAIMIATGTRMTVIGIVITLALIVFTHIFTANRGRVVKKLVTFGAYAAVAAVIIAGAWSALPQNLVIKKNFQAVMQGQLDASGMGRLFSLYVGWEAFKSSPALGIGNGNYNRFLVSKFGHLPIPYLFLSLPHAHNVPIHILNENGIVGITIILVFVCMALMQALKYARQPNAPRSAYSLFIGFAVMSFLAMFDAPPYYPSTIIWGAWLLGAMVQLPVEREIGMLPVKPSVSGA